MTPCTKCRWKAKKTATGTTSERNAPGASTSMLLPNCRIWDWSATVSGCEALSAKRRATSMSFQTHRNWKMARLARAGRPTGRTSWTKMRHSLPPSIRAASSISRGISAK